MALDYRKIREDKKKEYGTKVGNYGRLLANLYSDRAHFIFELLQNAEDALGDRGSSWQGSRAVSFDLTREHLRVGHFGRPFDETDVRGICEIGESPKADDLTSIGRFGVGFKSVYTITDRPEIHSGTEDFAIENYVLPEAAPEIDKGLDETVFLFPPKPGEGSEYDDIAVGLRSLGASSLLFLRHIDEVQWHIDDGRSGHYLRELSQVDEEVRRVTVIGHAFGEPDVSTEWLVFSSAVSLGDGSPAGHVEIAFFLDPEHGNIRPVNDSRLVVFFPTTLETHLGFLIQGPYQTTPSRDSVPSYVPWNKHLVDETSMLLVHALHWLRDRNQLSTAVLRCLPLNSNDFGAAPGLTSPLLGGRSPDRTSMFAPLFAATKRALSSDPPLLPCWNSGYVSARRALLGRTEGIRRLFSETQLSALYGSGQEMEWLSGDITQDRTPELRDYLMRELDVEELDPEALTRKLNAAFLERQSDSWITELYEFLNGQPAIIRMLTGQVARSYSVEVALIRLTDGKHVVPGKSRAFLPSEAQTDFPTVRPAVCSTPDALNFLRSVGVREPDLVDDVTQNVLPKYQQGEVRVDDAEYEADIGRIIRAFATDSTAQRELLLQKLRESMFVKTVATRGTAKSHSRPNWVYLASDSLRNLFHGVEDVRIADDSYQCLCGQQIKTLLEACGASSHLKAIPVESRLTYQQKVQLRQGAGSTRPETSTDWTLLGLDALLRHIQSASVDLRREKAHMLWEALIEFLEKEGTQRFSGTYRWHYYSWQEAKFPARFVEQLNESTWVPDKGDHLCAPGSIVFESLGWREHPFLQSQIVFRQPEPPIVATLAKEAGIEAESLDLILQHSVTAEQLRAWLGLTEGSKDNGPALARSDAEARNLEPREDNRDHPIEGTRPAWPSPQGHPTSPENEDLPRDDESMEPFAKLLFEASVVEGFIDADRPTIISREGPLTEESAWRQTQESGRFGRSGTHTRKTVKRWEPTEAAATLAEEFKAMVHGDYGRRCQICGTTFRMRSGGLQTFVVHVVEPKGDSRTNHLGDLMGLCGHHFSLVRYGEWTWLNPETGSPFESSEGIEGWECWRNFVLNAEGTDAERTDDDGNIYIGLPVRFWNVYEEWEPQSSLVNTTVRYSKPHWRYLCELLKT